MHRLPHRDCESALPLQPPADQSVRAVLRRRCELFLLFAVSLFLAWLGNDRVSLWDRDEPRYVESARHMRQTGDYIVPYFNDDFRYQKPVLTYWFICLADAVLGETEFSARLFSGLAIAGTCLLVHCLGDRMFGRPAGRVAGWTFAVTPLVVGLSKVCIPDGIQLFLATAVFTCLYCLIDERQQPAAARRPAFWFWLSLGLAVLTKGPIVPGMVFATLLLHQRLARLSWRAIPFHLRWGLPLFLLTAVPWFAAIYWAAGPGFYSESVGKQILTRVTSSFDGKFWPPGYYLLSLVVGFAPWLVIAGVALTYLRCRIRHEPALCYLVAWLLGPMIVLELFQSKQVHYYAPAYPALALLLGGYAAAIARGSATLPASRRVRRWCAVLNVLIGLAPALAVIGWANWCSETGLLPALMLGLFQLIGLVAFAHYFLRGRLQPALACCVVALAASWVVLGGAVLPRIAAARVLRPVAERLAEEHRRRRLPVMIHQLIEPSLIFYSGLAIPMYFEEDAFLAVVRDADRDILLPLGEKEFQRLGEKLPGRLEILHSWRGTVKLRKDVVYLVRLLPHKPEGEDSCAMKPSSRL